MSQRSGAGRQAFAACKIGKSRRHQSGIAHRPELSIGRAQFVRVQVSDHPAYATLLFGHARSSAGSAHHGRKSSGTLCLTLQSRGTKIVPILLPLSQALDLTMIRPIIYLMVAGLLIGVAQARADAPAATKSSGPQADGYCIELNGFGLPAGYLNLRKIISIEDASASEKHRLTFYKAVKSPNSDEILYVFSIGGWDDIYTVVALDAKQQVIRRRFPYGSLHYPCPKRS